MWGGGGTVNIGRVGAIGKRFLTLSPPLFGLLDDATGEGGSVWSERRLKIFVLISSLTASPPPPPHLLCQGLNALSPTVPTHYTNHHQLTKALFPFIFITILTLPKLSTFLTSHSVIFRFLHHSYNCVVIWDLVDFPLDGCFFDIYY